MEIKELQIPPVVQCAEQKAEMARIWVADGKQIVILSSKLWDDPGFWGMMLVDLAKHVANAYANAGHSRPEALARIRQFMEEEWESPTDEATEIRSH